LDVITPIITTTLKHPDAVGEARTVETHEENLELDEKRTNTAISQSTVRALPIRPNSF